MKKEKELARLLARKILKPPEAERMVRLDGWVRDPNDTGSSSHKQFIHPFKPGKVTIPFHSGDLSEWDVREIKKQAGLL